MIELGNEMIELGTRIEIVDESKSVYEGRVVGHGFVHREHLRWAARNEPYPVLLVEITRGCGKGNIRVIAPDAVEIIRL